MLFVKPDMNIDVESVENKESGKPEVTTVEKI